MDNSALRGLLFGIAIALGIGGFLGIYAATAEANNAHNPTIPHMAVPQPHGGAFCEGPRVAAESAFATSRYADSLAIRINRDQYMAKLEKDHNTQQQIAQFLQKKEIAKVKTIEPKQILAKKPTASKQIAKKPAVMDRPLSNGSVHYVIATAYTSEVAQTDASPCTTANGFNVCKNGVENVIAANWLKLGTKVRIPDQFGNRVFTVQDRMAKKHSDKIDIWMKNKKNALQFGKRTVKVEVLK